MRSHQCVILVGGLGTRLGPLTEDCPKPLLPVAGKPFLYYLIWNARRFGFDDFVLLAGYKGEMVRQFANEIAVSLSCQIHVVVEDSPQGTGGALRQAEHLLDDDFLLMNGDSFFDFNLLDLESGMEESPFLARIALRQVENAFRFGVVTLVEGRVSGFSERPPQSGPGLVNGGVYALSRKILEHIPAESCSLEREVFPGLAERGCLAGKAYEGFFLDIGIPEDFARAQQVIPDAMRRPAVFFDRDGVLNHDAGYTHRIEDFRWVDGAREAIRLLNDRGWYVFVVTNQAGVARGYYDEADVQRLHRWMNEDLASIGAHIDDFRYCPHHVDGSRSNYSIRCGCRKPAPGMILDLIKKWPVQIGDSFLLGDKQSDLNAAQAAGIRGVLYRGGNVRSLLG
jgi:D-glycero-D-manno-heptose 1,7-bisphosphate phosphatase